MKPRGFLALCMGVALVAVACGDADNDSTLDTMQDTNPPLTEPARPSADAMPDRGAEQMASGTLGKVDPDARTFTLNTDNREQSFRFNEATNVTGAAGTQGLAGREGDRVTVHYRDDMGSMIATRIVIEGDAPAAQPSQPVR